MMKIEGKKEAGRRGKRAGTMHRKSVGVGLVTREYFLSYVGNISIPRLGLLMSSFKYSNSYMHTEMSLELT